MVAGQWGGDGSVTAILANVDVPKVLNLAILWVIFFKL